MTFDELVEALKDEGGHDVSTTMRGAWLNEVHKRAVAESQWQMESLSLGVTVVDGALVVIPDRVVDIVGLYLDDGSGPAHYARVSTTDLWDLKGGRRSVSGPGGVFGPAFGDVGERFVELWPAPKVAGVAIEALAAVVPATMVSGSSPVIPEDMHGDLKDGAIALGLLRVDERPDAAAVFDARLREMIVKLGRRKRSRVGSGTARMKVYGTDWR